MSEGRRRELLSKSLKLILLIVLALFCIGCSNLFVKNNKPKTIQENNNLQNDKEISSLNNVKGFRNITQGVIGDICASGENIILLREDDLDPETHEKEKTITYNLSLYNLKDEKIHNITSSPINLLFNKFDATEEGIYYLENKEESLFQLYWFNINDNKKARISSPDHQVSPSFYVKSNNEVYYGTKDGKIIKANKRNILRIIDIGSEYYIHQIYFSESRDLILFSAFKDESLGLYLMNSKGEDFKELLSNISGSFDISKGEDKILYTTPIPDSNKSILWLLELDGNDKGTKLLEGYPQRAVFSPKEDGIAYLDRSDSNTDLLSIWIISIKDLEKNQVASNLKITSGLFWHPWENKLFFSTYESRDNKLQSHVYSLDFEI